MLPREEAIEKISTLREHNEVAEHDPLVTRLLMLAELGAKDATVFPQPYCRTVPEWDIYEARALRVLGPAAAAAAPTASCPCRFACVTMRSNRRYRCRKMKMN